MRPRYLTKNWQFSVVVFCVKLSKPTKQTKTSQFLSGHHQTDMYQHVEKSIDMSRKVLKCWEKHWYIKKNIDMLRIHWHVGKSIDVWEQHQHVKKSIDVPKKRIERIERIESIESIESIEIDWHVEKRIAMLRNT